MTITNREIERPRRQYDDVPKPERMPTWTPTETPERQTETDIPDWLNPNAPYTPAPETPVTVPQRELVPVR